MVIMTIDNASSSTRPETVMPTKPSNSAPSAISPRLTSSTHTLHSNGHAHTSTAGDSIPNLGDSNAKCGGCGRVIEQESGGVVVAFGWVCRHSAEWTPPDDCSSFLWHVDCFRCAKCRERVSADTNLLLLSDGNPVCGNCSYQVDTITYRNKAYDSRHPLSASFAIKPSRKRPS